MSKTGSKAANNSEKKPRGKGKPFRPNNPETGEKDPRINRSGQPRKFPELRDRALDILGEEKDLGRRDPETGETVVLGKISELDVILREWKDSRDYQKQAKLLEFAFGKVPDELQINSQIYDFIMANIHLFTDGQLRRLKQRENPMTILAELLNEVQEHKRSSPVDKAKSKKK